MKLPCLTMTQRELEIEREQLLDEGKDIASLEPEFEVLSNLDPDASPELHTRVLALLDAAQELPERPEHPYNEPNDLAAIRGLRPEGPRRYGTRLKDGALRDRILGALEGRCAGCLLGKPVEGIRSPMMWGILKDLGKYPLSEYFRTIPADVLAKYNMPAVERPYIDRVNCMPPDDDTNYTVANLALLAAKGADFTPEDVAQFWISHLPLMHTCTAERVAYCNFANLVPPPQSAVVHNPYREWIGAQIRADAFGYAAVGHPELAGELAWRDASISHIKNGIYGEMWVAAMLAAAPFEDSAGAVIAAGLSEIPADCRLAQDVGEVLKWCEEGIGYDDAVARVHAKWDENKPHHWCHTISNAQIVAIGLLWGEGDFERSVCRAVQACFDTDCNGATVGSIMGMMLGAKRLPEKWIHPLNNTVETGVAGFQRLKISELAQQTVELHRKVVGNAR